MAGLDDCSISLRQLNTPCPLVNIVDSTEHFPDVICRSFVAGMPSILRDNGTSQGSQSSILMGAATKVAQQANLGMAGLLSATLIGRTIIACTSWITHRITEIPSKPCFAISNS